MSNIIEKELENLLSNVCLDMSLERKRKYVNGIIAFTNHDEDRIELIELIKRNPKISRDGISMFSHLRRRENNWK